jgi:hypothetical protein
MQNNGRTDASEAPAFSGVLTVLGSDTAGHADFRGLIGRHRRRCAPLKMILYHKQLHQ